MRHAGTRERRFIPLRSAATLTLSRPCSLQTPTLVPETCTLIVQCSCDARRAEHHHARRRYKRTPLHMASRKLDVVQALLDAGADVDATDECVCCAQIFSCRNCLHTKLIRYAGASNRLCTWRLRLPKMPMSSMRFWMQALTFRPEIRAHPLCSRAAY
jgi:hypothetical protein